MTPFTGDKPQRNDRTTFSSRVDAFITWWLDTFWDELQTVILAFNFNATNSTSTTSLTIGSGSNKTLTVQASKSYLPGMTVKIAYTTTPTNWMLGEVISYDSVTGVLVVYIRTINGSGTYAAWTITLAATTDAVGDKQVACITGNGHGSTDTTVRLLTTTVTNTLGATISHSATAGTSVTIPEAGMYEIFAQDHFVGAPASKYWGISLNTKTGISTAGNAASLALAAPSAAGVIIPVTRTVYLAANDVIRMLDTGNTMDGIDYVKLVIRKVSNG